MAGRSSRKAYIAILLRTLDLRAAILTTLGDCSERSARTRLGIAVDLRLSVMQIIPHCHRPQRSGEGVRTDERRIEPRSRGLVGRAPRSVGWDDRNPC